MDNALGLLTFLACFFKSPLGTDEHDFSLQFQMLESWVANVERRAAAKCEGK